jgi:N-acetylglucosamine malate deacetylase 2
VRQWVEAFGPAEIYTHAYEGGHPDHDAVALALSGLEGVREFPLYHASGADFVPHSFLDGAPGRTVELTEAQRERKRKLLACFASQQRVIGNFPVAVERFRPAPAYDFARRPHAGPLYYEIRRLGWTFEEWREAVAG